MTSPATSRPADRTEIGSWFRRHRALLALLRRKQYRRDVYTLLWIGLRGLVDWRLLGASVLLLVATAWFFLFRESPPWLAYEALQGIFALAAIAAGSTLYSMERDQGTLELVWLATGSERALLRLKVVVYLLALAVVIVPCVVLASLLEDRLPPARLLLFMFFTNSLFILAFMAYVGTWLPHAWAAGLLGLAILGSAYFSFMGTPFSLNPFLSPVVREAAPMMMGGGAPPVVPNRVILLVASAILLQMAAGRLRKTF